MSPIFSPQAPAKRNVFISFHHEEEPWRDKFNELFGDHFINYSVELGDIDPENDDEYIKRLIQQGHIVSSSVIFVLYGAATYKRRFIDWEISAALSEKVGGHKGLVVMLLPTFPTRPFNALGQYDQSLIDPYLHPRTSANLKSGYADLYFWPGMYPTLPGVHIKDVIEAAATKRETHDHLIDNSHPQYQYNRS